MDLLLKLLIQAIAVMVTAWILPGVHIMNFWTAIVVAIILSLLNIFLKPILVILTIPISIFNFGIFLLVINALITLLAGKIVPGFTLDGFWWAFLFSIILSLISYLLGVNNLNVNS
jgi:putative membrane protein